MQNGKLLRLRAKSKTVFYDYLVRAFTPIFFIEISFVLPPSPPSHVHCFLLFLLKSGLLFFSSLLSQVKLPLLFLVLDLRGEKQKKRGGGVMIKEMCVYVMQKRLAWALFVLLVSTLMCELIWAFLFHKNFDYSVSTFRPEFIVKSPPPTKYFFSFSFSFFFDLLLPPPPPTFFCRMSFSLLAWATARAVSL